MNPLCNDQSLVYRKVATFQTQLRLLQLESERLHVVSWLAAGNGELEEVARRICDWECDLLRVQSVSSSLPKTSSTKHDDEKKEEESSIAINESTALVSLRKDIETGRCMDFVLQMQLSYNRVQGKLQEHALGLLRKHLTADTKSSLVQAGVLDGIVDTMKNFPMYPKIQHHGTALLIAFICNDQNNVGIIDKEGNRILADDTRIPPNEGIDIGILRLVQDLGGCDVLLNVMEKNLYQLKRPLQWDFIKAAGHQQAAAQIPAVIKRIQSLVLQSTPRRLDVVMLHRKCHFLRKCYGTLLEDEDISAMTFFTLYAQS